MASREGAEGYVYRIKHHDCSDDIVDAVVDILDGPQPMRDCKPAKMIRNSADQFWEAHQAEYEARGRASGGHVDRVHRHNTAYPSLRDELDKRRSLTKVTAANANRCLHLDRDCTSLKSKRIKYTKRLKAKTRHRAQSGHKLKSKYRDNRTPRRNRLHGSKMKLKKMFSSEISVANKSCQYQFSIHVIDKKIGSDNGINFQKSAPKLNSSVGSNTFKNKSDVTDKTMYLNEMTRDSYVHSKQKSNPNSSKNESKSEVLSHNPDTSEPSVTSYNSFMSVDHEPMVSP